jgi:hypothetical protein
MAVLEVARPQGGQLAVNFYPFRHFTPYAYSLILNSFKDQTQRRAQLVVGKTGFPIFVFQVFTCVHFQTKKLSQNDYNSEHG